MDVSHIVILLNIYYSFRNRSNSNWAREATQMAIIGREDLTFFKIVSSTIGKHHLKGKAISYRVGPEIKADIVADTVNN